MWADESSQADTLLRRHRPLVSVALRFLLGGALNTGLTLALYWVLLRFMHYQWAYFASFCAGILISYLINTRYVFRAQHNWLKFAAFPFIYLVTYALGGSSTETQRRASRRAGGGRPADLYRCHVASVIHPEQVGVAGSQT